MKKTVLSVVLVAVVIAVAVVALTHKSSNTNDSSAQNSSTPASSSSSSSSSTKAVASIAYSASGFSPSTITVKSGDTVAIKNTSSTDMQFDSDPHPVHSDDTDLNAGLVSPGQTLTFTVTKKGTFGYHNHLDPSQRGTIVIK